MEEVKPIAVQDKNLFVEMMKANFPEIINFLVTDEKGKKVLERYMATRAFYVMAIWELIVESINYGDLEYGEYSSEQRAKMEDEPEPVPPGTLDIPDMPMMGEPGSEDVSFVNWERYSTNIQENL